MTPRFGRTTLFLIMICIALPAWGQQYILYAPQPAPADQQAPSQKGILVREIEIQKGDTLSKLSRKFSGHGMYFPQILLFNDIKNPDLIYTGNTLRVPVTQTETPASDRAGSSTKQKTPGHKKSPRKSSNASPARKASAAAPASAASTELSLSDLNKVGAKNANTTKGSRKSITSLSQEPLTSTTKRKDTATAREAAGQQLYQAAVKAFQQEDCRTALGLFDRYLADNSASPLAAEANLYKAECYLKLSAQ